MAMAALKWAGRSESVLERMRQRCVVSDPRLESAVFGLKFPNPIGLAAGFDKNAVAVPGMAALGFGFIEVGTITALAQPGNPKPRMFRSPKDQTLINRLGFNNEGVQMLAKRIQELRREQQGKPAGRIPLGINLGKSKMAPIDKATEDYLKSFRLLKTAGDYFVINVSSPNTPDLRKLQDKDRLDELLGALQQENQNGSPLLVKIAPDLTLEQIDDVMDLIAKHKLAGVIATNTTIQRPGIQSRNEDVYHQGGGLSGRSLRSLANRCIRHVAERAQGRIPIIGVGGVFTAEDAYEKLRLGASLVQIYTGFVYGGPGTVAEINRGLLRLMERDGVKHISEVVGKYESMSL
jgi:dihydroorotate dehydrogenase